MRFLLCISGFLAGLILCSASAGAQDTLRKAGWLPKGNLFPVISLDYKENQVSGSLYAFHADDQWQNKAFANFSLGFRRNLIRWNPRGISPSELGIEMGIFTQFLFEDPFRTFQANFFNVDFQVGIHYNRKWNGWSFRGRIYHISAHLGDDFIYRYNIEHYLDNPRIYETADLSAAWQNRIFMVYATTGVIFHSAYERLPLLLQGGFQFTHPVGRSEWLRWFAGTDVKMEQEQGFRPNLHAGAGIGIGRTDRFPILVMIDYYNGYLPYSLYDGLLIQWLGASICFSIF